MNSDFNNNKWRQARQTRQGYKDTSTTKTKSGEITLINCFFVYYHKTVSFYSTGCTSAVKQYHIKRNLAVYLCQWLCNNSFVKSQNTPKLIKFCEIMEKTEIWCCLPYQMWFSMCNQFSLFISHNCKDIECCLKSIKQKKRSLMINRDLNKLSNIRSFSGDICKSIKP